MERTVKADESVSYTVVSAVAEAEGCCLTDLPPLYGTVDVDALNGLVFSETDESPKFEGSLMFEFSDSSVSIWSDRSVTVSVHS